MAVLVYGAEGIPIHIPEQLLAHVKVVVTTKLRRHESFMMSWRHVDGSGRSSIWLEPSIPLMFMFDSVEEPPLLDDLDDEDAALRELATCLAPMLSQLAPAYQEAVRIVDLEGVTQQEAARRAGVSLSGMKSRVQRGRQQLRAVLEACCRIDLDHRGSIAGYAARHPDACGCGGCSER